MGKLEELPDDYQENPDIPLTNYKLNTPPSSTTTTTPSAPNAASTHPADAPVPIPDLPPTIADYHGQSVDEVVADLKKSPFFMTSAEDLAAAPDNPDLDAFKALLYEGTRFENADNFREQGNEQVRARLWKDGREFYTKGLGVLAGPEKGRTGAAEEEEEEQNQADLEGKPRVVDVEEEERQQRDAAAEQAARDEDLRVKLLVNRALCQLELQNYRSCVNDCLAALGTGAGRSNVKAWFRMASALFGLGRWEEAAKACAGGLALDADNGALAALSAKVDVRREAAQRAERARLERVQREEQVKRTLATALAARKIVMRWTKERPEMPDDAVLKLTPDPLDVVKSTLVFPAVVLYPLHAQSDVVKAFGEEQTLAGHLEYLLPLPWDARSEYKIKEVEAYLETKDGGLLKWGKNVELLRVLSGGKVEVVDGIVRVNVLPKSRVQEWITVLKERKAKR